MSKSHSFPSDRAEFSSVWFWGFLIAAATLGAYWPALHAGFIWDDDDYVTGNRTLLSVEGLWKIWSDPSATPQYYPLVHSSFWVEHWLWGFDPLGYHVDNVLLHALGAVLLWRVLARLSVPGAWLAAAVFAVHPVAVESVAWVTERKNVLSGVFYLAALLSYLRFEGVAREPGGAGATGRCWRHYGVALVLFVFALWSKTVVCTLPAVLLLLLWWKRGRVGWAQVWPLVPMFVLGAGLGLLTAWMEKHQVGAKGVEWELSWVQRCLIAGRALWFYAGKLLWPQQLTFIYERWEVDAGVAWQYVFPLAALGVIGLLWLWRERLGRGPLVAVLCYCGTLFPALGFIDVFPMRYSFVADHFQYLASIGLIAPGVALVCLAARRWRLRGILLEAGSALLLLLLGTLTWCQCGMYRDIETLWNITLERNPSCWMAHNNLGVVLLEKGDVDQALTHCQKAVELYPDYAESHYNLGNSLLQKGLVDEATSHYQKALKINPDYPQAHSNLGSALLLKGQVDNAAAQYELAIKINPMEMGALNNLAWILATSPEPAQRNGAKALDLAQRASQTTGGNHPQVLHTLAAAYAECGRFTEADESAERALSLANAQGNSRLADMIRNTRSLYQAGKPMREIRPAAP